MAIIAAAKAGHKVIVVQAGAGCGKTATDKMIAEELGGRGQYTAFNAPLCAEAKTKMPNHVAVNTIHSLAFRAEGWRYKHRLNTGRVKAEEVARRLGIEALELGGKRLAPGFLAAQVLGAIRRFCNSADAEPGEQHFAYQDGIDMPDGQKRTYTNNNRMREHLLPFARRAWEDLRDTKGTLPFSHDCYAKIWELNNPVVSCDYLLVDESQDLVGRDVSIIRKQTCQVILVGDSAQTIYAWRGCEDALSEFPDAPTLFLSQSFRFGQKIADVANAVLATLDEPTALRLKGLPSIKSRVVTKGSNNGSGVQHQVGAPDDLATGTLQRSGSPAPGQHEDGLVAVDQRPRGVAQRTSTPRTKQTSGVSYTVPTSGASGHELGMIAILTRTNACAVATLLNSMTQGKRPFLVGGGSDVIAFVEAAKQLKEGRGTSHPELACFANWAEVEEYSKETDGEDLRLMVKLIKEFGCDAILRALRSMPPEDQADMIISTSHRSKGREWNHVKLASDFKVESKCDDAERKLLYVAVTRAKLVLDVSGCPFFTGQDSLDLTKVVQDERKQGERAEDARGAAHVGGGSWGNQQQNENDLGVPQNGGEEAPNGRDVPASGVQPGQATQEVTNDDAKAGGKGVQQKTFVPMNQAEFTWTKFREVWMIRGPKGRTTGEQVTVVRKGGSKSKERLGAVAWDNETHSIYRVFR